MTTTLDPKSALGRAVKAYRRGTTADVRIFADGYTDSEAFSLSEEMWEKHHARAASKWVDPLTKSLRYRLRLATYCAVCDWADERWGQETRRLADNGQIYCRRPSGVTVHIVARDHHLSPSISYSESGREVWIAYSPKYGPRTTLAVLERGQGAHVRDVRRLATV